MSERFQLELIGITYNQIESGVYALILQEKGGRRRLPIIIGYPEAQAIECKLQEVVTPRPLTHDLMVSIMDAFGISLRNVTIHKLPNGVFAADLAFSNGIEKRVVDSRSSDAVALAIRVGAPIFTTRQVLEECSVIPGDKMKRISSSPERGINCGRKPDDLSSMNIEQLYDNMEKAAAEEDYERAALLKAELNRRLDAASDNSTENPSF